jgi:MFS transporter, SP family, major inositol transporter
VYNEEGVLSSAVVLGAAIGSLCAGHIADTIGPRLAQITNAVPFLLGTFLCCLSPGQHIGFLLGRVVTGFGASARLTCCYAALLELAALPRPPHPRSHPLCMLV